MKIKMNIYKTLDDVDNEIRRFYQVVNGVVTLLVPEYIVYEVCDKNKKMGFSWADTKPLIEKAILWEDFYVNHELYNQWKQEHYEWTFLESTKEIQHEDGSTTTEVVIPEPIRPTINLENRRSVYHIVTEGYDHNLYNFNGKYTITFDDDNYIKHQIPVIERKPDSEIISYYRTEAKNLRDKLISDDIEVFGVYWQVKDRGANLREILSDAELLGLPDTTSAPFRLADNTWRETTLAEVKDILRAYILRYRTIWDEFNKWDHTDRLTPFHQALIKSDDS